MNNRSEIRDFLATRRARLTPEQAGLAAYGRNRRVLGLRREDVAILAGVSVDYYTRLERGDLTGASDSVLEALSQALPLDQAEIAHLFDLARAAATRGRTRHAAAKQVRERAAGPGEPNTASEHGQRTRPTNTARFAFLDPRAKEFYADWERSASDMIAVRRAAAGRNSYDRGLTDLVGELSTRSQEFRTRWAAHNVLFRRTGFRQLHHPVLGDLDLLASWAATVEQEQRVAQEQRVEQEQRAGQEHANDAS